MHPSARGLCCSCCWGYEEEEEGRRLLVRWPGKLAAAAFQTLSHSTLTTRPFWTQQKKKKEKERKKRTVWPGPGWPFFSLLALQLALSVCDRDGCVYCHEAGGGSKYPFFSSSILLSSIPHSWTRESLLRVLLVVSNNNQPNRSRKYNHNNNNKESLGCVGYYFIKIEASLLNVWDYTHIDWRLLKVGIIFRDRSNDIPSSFSQ